MPSNIRPCAASALTLSWILPAMALAQSAGDEVLRPGVPARIEIVEEFSGDGGQYGDECRRVVLEPGQSYRLTATKLEPEAKRWLVVQLYRDPGCQGEPVHSTSTTGRTKNYQFQSEGGSFFANVKMMAGPVELRLDPIESNQAHRIGKGIDLPATPRLAGSGEQTATLASAASGSAPDAPSSAASEDTLLRYRGGIQKIELGQEIQGNTGNGVQLKNAHGLTATIAFEGRKGQQICIRGAGPDGFLPIVFMEQANKAEPKLQPLYASYPTDPTFLHLGTSMLITLPKNGTYYLWPRMMKVGGPDYKRTVTDAVTQEEFALKLWDANLPEPDSQSSIMQALDRPTKFNGVDYGVIALIDGQPIAWPNYNLVTQTIMEDGAIRQDYVDLRNGNRQVVTATPAGPRKFTRMGSSGPAGTLVLSCDGTVRFRANEYGDDFYFVTVKHAATGSGKKELMYLHGRNDSAREGEGSYSPGARLTYYDQELGLVATEENVSYQIMWADISENVRRRDEAQARIYAAEERARQDRVWAGVLGALAKTGDYVQEYSQPSGAQPRYDSVNTVSPYQGFKDMDQATAARASQLAQGFALSQDSSGKFSTRREPERRDAERTAPREEGASYSIAASAGGGTAVEPLKYVGAEFAPPPEGYAPWKRFYSNNANYMVVEYTTRATKDEIRVIWRCTNESDRDQSCSIGAGADKEYPCFIGSSQSAGSTRMPGERATVRSGQSYSFPGDWACRGTGATDTAPIARIAIER